MDVDLSGPLKVSLDKALAEARTLESQNKCTEASALYMKAAKLMRIYADYALTRDDQQRRRQKSRQYLEVAEALKSGKRRVAPLAPPPQGQGDKLRERATEDGEQQNSNEIASLIHRSKVTWDKIGGLEVTKRAIKF